MKEAIVIQTRSGHGTDPKCKATLCALGLGRIGKKRKVSLSSPIIGMIRRVKHLVEVYSI